MDESRVLARLDRIDELRPRAARLRRELQAELRGLLREAEATTRGARRGEERDGGGGRASTHGAGTGHNRHVIAHWDEAESAAREPATSAGEWTDLGMAAGTVASRAERW